MTPPPFLSLCVICGDSDQAKLPRLLDSVLRRASGSSADEVVVWWNGSGEGPESLAGYGVDGVDLRIVKGEWKDDFGWARQKSFEAARGVWRMYLDADDILAAGTDNSVVNSAPVRGAAPSHPVGTLVDLLRDLPPAVNTMWFPYHYALDEKTGVPLQK